MLQGAVENQRLLRKGQSDIVGLNSKIFNFLQNSLIKLSIPPQKDNPILQTLFLQQLLNINIIPHLFAVLANNHNWVPAASDLLDQLRFIGYFVHLEVPQRFLDPSGHFG